VNPTNPVQPPPPAPTVTPTPAPTPAPPTPPTPTPQPTRTPNPTPIQPWNFEDLLNALKKASDSEILNSLRLKPEQLDSAKDLFQKITPEQFKDWTLNYFDQNHDEIDLGIDFEELNIKSLSDFGNLIDEIELDRENFLQFLESNANPPPPPPPPPPTPSPTPPPTPTPNPSNG
jgi:hypothetical protein